MAGLRCNSNVVIVTGGACGIGEACVRQFVENGAKVVIADINDEKATALAVELNTTYPGAVHFVHCDVTDDAAVKAMVAATIGLHDKIDCLLNDAGAILSFGVIDNISTEDFQRQIDLNLTGYFRTCKYTLPYLRKSKGCIINIASITATIGGQAMLPYVTSKAGIVGLTKALAVDEAQSGVRVNSVSPGAVETPLVQTFLNSYSDHRTRKEIETLSIMNRLADPLEIAKAVLFLAVDATYMTGHDMLVSGGTELHHPEDQSSD